MHTKVINLIFDGETISFHVFPATHGNKLADHLSNWHRKRKTFYEQDDLLYSRQFLRPNDIVLDCGANMGNHTVFWSKICGCKVRSFEPTSETYKILQKNIQSNECNVIAHNIILGKGGDKKYKADVNARSYGEAQYLESEDGKKSFRIDDLIDEKISLIKIDTEGHEIDILLGAEKTIKSSHPVLWIETHEYTGRYRSEDLINLTKSFGYGNPIKGKHQILWFTPEI